MFRTEGSELVKGSMLAMTIEAILDFAGPRSGKFRMIECEVSSHDARAISKNGHRLSPTAHTLADHALAPRAICSSRSSA
jgi:hypothetical protein